MRFLGRDCAQPDQVYFWFECETVEKARAFIDAPDAAAQGRLSGVIDGEYHFLDGARDY